MNEYLIDNVAKKIIIYTDNPRNISASDIIKIHNTEKVMDFGVEIKVIDKPTSLSVSSY